MEFNANRLMVGVKLENWCDYKPNVLYLDGDSSMTKKTPFESRYKNGAVITRLLLGFEAPYVGSPYFITGNALNHAVKKRMDTSFGIFTQHTYLSPVKTYKDFFAPRFEKGIFPSEIYQSRTHYICYFFPRFVTFDISGDKRDLFSVGREIQLGARRNELNGLCFVKEVALIHLDDLEYPEEVTWATFVSPSAKVPQGFIRHNIRRIEVKFLFGSKPKLYQKLVEQGQTFRIVSEEPIVKICKMGILRVGAGVKIGLGEYYCH